MTAPLPQTGHPAADRIARRWLAALRFDPLIPSAERLGDGPLLDQIPPLIKELLCAAAPPAGPAPAPAAPAELHGRGRAGLFGTSELVREFQLLRHQLFLHLREHLGSEPASAGRGPGGYADAGEAFDEALRCAVEAFVGERTAELRRLSVTDSLTGLNNRRSFFERLGEEIKRAARHGSRLSVALLDLDDFKGVNTAGGHAAGDVVLRDCARLIRGMLRESDLACRYGGDEFAVVLPETGREQAEALLTRVREAVGEAGKSRGLPASFGLSYGAAEFVADGREAGELMRAADARLLGGKRRR